MKRALKMRGSPTECRPSPIAAVEASHERGKKEKLRSGICRGFFTRFLTVCSFFVFSFSFFILTSCAKYSAECELVVNPRLMVSIDSQPGTPAEQVRIYVFYNVGKYIADVEKWNPASYAEASAGIISRTDDRETFRTYNLMAEQSDEDDYASVRLVLSSSPVMLVAVDPVHRLYGWRFFEYMIPMPRVELVAYFRPYIITENHPFDDYLQWDMRSEKFD